MWHWCPMTCNMHKRLNRSFFLNQAPKKGGCGNKYGLQDLLNELSMNVPRLRLGLFVTMAMKEPPGSLFL